MSTIKAGTTSTTAYQVEADTTGDLVIATGASANVAMTVNSSGNIGVGVTPSAWGSGWAALQIKSGGASLWSDGARRFFLSSNVYYDGSNRKYQTTGEAAEYVQNGGVHSWHTAPSGTAGNTITFTQAMTLDASGRLGIGTTSPATTLAVLATTPVLQLTTSGAGTGAQDGFQIQFDGANNYVWGYENVPTLFGTNNAERARITSGGDLYLGKSASSASTVGFEWTASGRVTHVFTESSTNECYTYNNTSTSGTAVIDFRTNNVTKGRITWDNTNTTYATTSDRRLKDNITPAADAGAVIDAIEVVKHDWKVGGHTRYGMIAQDLNEVAPEAVTAGDDGEEIERAWGVDYSKLVPMLVKEIQSLRVRSAALEAEVAALKAG